MKRGEPLKACSPSNHMYILWSWIYDVSYIYFTMSVMYEGAEVDNSDFIAHPCGGMMGELLKWTNRFPTVGCMMSELLKWTNRFPPAGS